MTDEEATALGKRLVACKGFRPLRGMLDMQGRTWDTSLLWRWNSDVDVPDLRQPATIGIALALLHETGTCGVLLVGDPDDWVRSLVAALEAAPR